MMQRILAPFLVLAAAAGFALPASAENTAQYLVIGSVPQICTVEQPVLLGTHPAINVTGLTGQSLTIEQLVNPETLATNAASFAVSFDAICTVPHNLIVESENNGLWRNTTIATATGFGDAVPYTAQVRWADFNATLHADAEVQHIKDLTLAVNRPASGQIELDFQILPGASNYQYFSPLLAGTYSDTIRVTVVPQ